MKIDNDLLRTMLLQIEEDTDGTRNYPINDYCKERFPAYELPITIYHMKYLSDAGYIQTGSGYLIDISPLGRDFLNNIRNDSVWKDTKEAIKPMGTVALNVVSEIAASIVKKVFNLSP